MMEVAPIIKETAREITWSTIDWCTDNRFAMGFGQAQTIEKVICEVISPNKLYFEDQQLGKCNISEDEHLCL